MARPWIDMVRDGARPADLRDGYDLGVSRVLGASALGALNTGYRRPQWEQEVLDPARSNLGRQIRVDRRGKVRTERAVSKMLGQAWDRADQQYEKSPRWTRETARVAAEERARVARDLAADADADLNYVQRAVLAYAAERAEATGSTRVNLPQSATAEALGLTPRQVRRALDRLGERHLLICRQRGRPSADVSKRLSSAYDLPDAEAAAAYLCRVPRQVRPLALTGAPRSEGNPAPPTLTDAPPQQHTTTTEENDMDGVLTTRMTADEHAAVLRLLADMRAGQSDAEVRHLHVADEPGQAVR